MPSSRLSLWTCLLACAAGLLLTVGCASTPEDKNVAQSPNKIYADAKAEMGGGNYEKAVTLLEKLEGRAAGTPLAQQAQLDKAYAQYKSGETAQAVATLERFVKLHPASPALDYALYLKGIVNFNDDLGLFARFTGQDLSERDQKAAKDSFEAFKELVTRFPDSRYSADARQRMQYTVNSLAQSEIHISRYYFDRGAYVAAINRAQQAVVDYPGVAAVEDALYLLYRAYDALGMTDLRNDAQRVLLANYPHSELLANGFRQTTRPWWKLW